MSMKQQQPIISNKSIPSGRRLKEIITMLQRDKRELLQELKLQQEEISEQVAAYKKARERTLQQAREIASLSVTVSKLKQQLDHAQTSNLKDEVMKDTQSPQINLVDELKQVKEATAQLRKHYEDRENMLQAQIKSLETENKNLRSHTQHNDTVQNNPRSDLLKHSTADSQGHQETIIDLPELQTDIDETQELSSNDISHSQSDHSPYHVLTFETLNAKQQEIWDLRQQVQSLLHERLEQDETVRSLTTRVEELQNYFDVIGSLAQSVSDFASQNNLSQIQQTAETIENKCRAAFDEEYVVSQQGNLLKVVEKQMLQHQVTLELTYAEVARLTEELVARMDDLSFAFRHSKQLETDKESLYNLCAEMSNALARNHIKGDWENKLRSIPIAKRTHNTDGADGDVDTLSATSSTVQSETIQHFTEEGSNWSTSLSSTREPISISTMTSGTVLDTSSTLSTSSFVNVNSRGSEGLVGLSSPAATAAYQRKHAKKTVTFALPTSTHELETETVSSAPSTTGGRLLQQLLAVSRAESKEMQTSDIDIAVSNVISPTTESTNRNVSSDKDIIQTIATSHKELQTNKSNTNSETQESTLRSTQGLQMPLDAKKISHDLLRRITAVAHTKTSVEGDNVR